MRMGSLIELAWGNRVSALASNISPLVRSFTAIPSTPSNSPPIWRSCRVSLARSSATRASGWAAGFRACARAMLARVSTRMGTNKRTRLDSMAGLPPKQDCFPDWLRADIAGVERACHPGIARALDDGAAVGKYCQFVRRHTEAQQEVVAAHLLHRRLEPPAECGQI